MVRCYSMTQGSQVEAARVVQGRVSRWASYLSRFQCYCVAVVIAGNKLDPPPRHMQRGGTAGTGKAGASTRRACFFGGFCLSKLVEQVLQSDSTRTPPGCIVAGTRATILGGHSKSLQ
jgi:hypothetical protein